MSEKRIEELDQVIKDYIPDGSEIIETHIANLTAPGENYGSEIYKIDVKIKNNLGEIEELNVVAKQIPNSVFYQEVFNIQVTFNAEKEFYNTIVPEIIKFQKKYDINVNNPFPKFFGGRNNLNGVNNVVDKDALIVLENLKVQGYKNLDRYVGFDLPTSQLIIKNLAQLHATAIALKLKDPETFERKVKSNCACFLVPPPPIDLSKETDLLVNLLKDSQLPQSVGECIRKSMRNISVPDYTIREPFATLVHTDFWVNNIMVKATKGEVSDVKIVDFQFYTYDSPIRDLLFFLFTSVETEVLKSNFKKLIKFYHEVFSNTLSNFKVDTSSFSYENYLKEFPFNMKKVLGFMTFMLVFVVRGKKGGVLKNKEDPTATPTFSADHVTSDNKERLFWLLTEFERNVWLNF